MTRVVVVGGGITGLTTALTLFHDHVDVELVEAADRLGGKILTTEVAGTPIDAGPDAFLVRQPHMRELCAQLHMTDDLVAPATGSARLWFRGALRPLPKRQYLGVPLDLDDLGRCGLLSADGLARAAQDLDRPDDRPTGDESAGSLIRRRLGDEVMDRLVGPLLGGINAGDADQLSLQAGVPQLAAAADHDPSLMRSIRRHLQATGRDPSAPIFLTHPNGLGQVVDAMATRLRGRTHLSHPVDRLERHEGGWRVHGPRTIDAEAVVVTTPAFAAADLVRATSPGAAAVLDDIAYASVVMVTLAWPTDQLPALEGSGFLVPRSEGLVMTACSQASSKWAHLRGPTTWLRVSAGHAGDGRALDMPDDDLVDRLLQELSWVAGIRTDPIEVRITRWPRSFPQYRPGHLERMAELDRRLAEEAPGLVVTGAAHRGLGLPACVHQGRVAAASVAQRLGVGARSQPSGAPSE